MLTVFTVAVLWALPFDKRTLIVSAHLVLTSIAIGVVLQPRESGATLERVLKAMLPAWIVIHSATAISLQFAFPELGMTPDQVSLPGSEILIRSPLDCLIWAGLLFALKMLIDASVSRGPLFRSLAGLAVLAWCGFLSRFFGGVAIGDYHLIFHPDWPPVHRAIGVFDLNTSLWPSLILPLSFVRLSLPPDEWSPLDVAPRSTRLTLIRSSLVLCAVAMGVGLKVVFFSDLPLLESLSSREWIAKIGSIGVWTAIWEETLYRGIVIMSLVSLIPSRVGRNIRFAAAGFGSICLFGLTHAGEGATSGVYALGFGVIATVLVVRYQSLDAAILSHELCDVLGLVWK